MECPLPVPAFARLVLGALVLAAGAVSYPATAVAAAAAAAAPAASATPTEPPLPLSSPEVRTEVEAAVRRMSAMFTDLKGPKPIELFDRAEPAPQYLAEEQPDWMIGWDKLEWYFNTPARNAVVQAMDMNPSNIRVRSLTSDLALATWDIFAEMKFRRGPPIGEKLRANAILRRTAQGWKFIYYAEAPKATMAYMQDLYENMARPEFKARFPAADEGTAPGK